LWRDVNLVSVSFGNLIQRNPAISSSVGFELFGMAVKFRFDVDLSGQSVQNFGFLSDVWLLHSHPQVFHSPANLN